MCVDTATSPCINCRALGCGGAWGGISTRVCVDTAASPRINFRAVGCGGAWGGNVVGHLEKNSPFGEEGHL